MKRGSGAKRGLVRVLGIALSTVVVVSTGITLLGLSAQEASAQSAPIRTTDYVNVRPGPSTSSGNPLAVMPPGTSPDFHCWTQGQNIYGVDVWFNITYNGVTGYYASYYDDSSYSTDSQITSKYGIPNCSTPTSAPPQAAVNWAASHIGQNFDSGYCLAFVFQAWTAAGVNLRNYVTVPIGNNTYPVDIWGHFNTGTTGGGTTPPAGALVFYSAKNGDRTLSHVTISVGNGSEISTSDGLGSVVHYETIPQHSYANYLGWWLP